MKTRVCMFLNASLSGDQRVFKEARTLADAGYEVTIICNQEPEQPSPVWRGITIIGIPRRPSLFSPGRFTFCWIREALRRKPDIIHAHDLNTLGRGWLVARLLGAKLVYDSHDYYTETAFVLRMPGWRRRYYSLKERFLIKRADRVIHAVPELCSIAAEEYRIRRPLLLANFPLGEPSPRSSILHDKFNLSPDTRIVIYEGIVARDRGLENLVLSARYLPEKIAVVILGRGYLVSRLKKTVDAEGLAGRVKFIDEVELSDFSMYCSAADIGIAIYENTGLTWKYGWGTKVFDYMRAGIPTLIYGSRATEDIVRNNEAGVIMDDISPRGIANSIKNLFSDGERYDRMRENAVSAWRRKFNWETEAAKLLKMYDEL